MKHKCATYGGETHGHRDSTDTVVDVTVRRAHRVGRDTSDVLDGLLGPSELSNDLLVGESGEEGVRPGVNRQLVSTGKEECG